LTEGEQCLAVAPFGKAVFVIFNQKLTHSLQIIQGELLTNIERQIKAAEAAIKGEFYAFTDFRYVTDTETGERTRKGVSVKVKQWFWQDIAGKYFLCIKYGSKKLEFAKSKFAVEVGDQKNIIPTFEKIAEAVKAGELDDIIANVIKFKYKRDK